MNGITELGLGWLFLSAFTSATLLPGSSEVLLGAMATKGSGHGQPAAVGDAGQYLGSMTTWWLGWLATFKKNRKIFKAVGNKKPSAGSNNMATGVCCWPGRR